MSEKTQVHPQYNKIKVIDRNKELYFKDIDDGRLFNTFMGKLTEDSAVFMKVSYEGKSYAVILNSGKVLKMKEDRRVYLIYNILLSVPKK